MNSNFNYEIIKNKKEISKRMNRLKISYLKEQELEVIVYKNLEEEAIKNPLSNDIKLKKIMEDTPVITVISKISWEDRQNRKISISGAASNLEFIISKWLMEKIDYLISANKGLGKITIRKHEENIYFVEEFESLLSTKEDNFRTVCKLRKNYSTDEWKNILLGTVGYDLRDSEGLTKDLLLIRLLPYVEKNYNYIELGGKATGKTTISEKFTTGEKISANISKSQLIYSIQKKKEGVLFNKDVLYLDETNFTSMSKEVAPALLQAKAGNEIEVRGDYDARRTDVSFVSQGNIENAEIQFKNRTLLKNFDKGFNNDAHFDRECFLIAGWLLPSYSNMNLKDDTLGIRLDIFEDYLSVLREKETYDNNIKNLNINLVGSTATGRFNEQIRKTISGLLKLLYPYEEIDFESEKKNIDSIALLSCFGKYLIQECAYDLGKVEYKNNYLECSYANSYKTKITRVELEQFYVKNKEIKYFIEEIPEQEDKVYIDIPWKIDSGKKIEVKGNLEYIKLRIPISEDFQNIFNEIPEENKKEKLKLEDSYKIICVYEECTKTLEETTEYLNAYTILLNFAEYLYKVKITLKKNSLNEIKELLQFLIEKRPENEVYQVFGLRDLYTTLPEHKIILEKFQNILDVVLKEENEKQIEEMDYIKAFTGKLVFENRITDFYETMYKIESLKDNILKLKFEDRNGCEGKIELKFSSLTNIMKLNISGILRVTYMSEINPEEIELRETSANLKLKEWEKPYEKNFNIAGNEYIETVSIISSYSLDSKFEFFKLNLDIRDVKNGNIKENYNIVLLDNLNTMKNVPLIGTFEP